MANATIVVDFGALVVDFHLSAELDNDLNGGKSSFQTTDAVYFRVYAGGEYSVAVTAGTVQKTQAKKAVAADPEVVNFIHGEPGSVTKPIKTITRSLWLGNALGSISKIGDTSVKASGASKTNIGVAQVSYDTEYDVWKLTPPASAPSVFAILIVITPVVG